MKFEKLNENKIRITLTPGDFEEKHINFHDFMSNPLESQDLFLDILEEAKTQIGFNTTDYRVKIEALAMIDGDFVVNVTRAREANIDKFLQNNSTERKKFKIKRKSLSSKTNQVVYKFETFDDYCNFIEYLHNSSLDKSYLIAKKIIAYIYKTKFYLILYNINNNDNNISKFYSFITEFGTYVNDSSLLISKIEEYGKIVIKNNALKIRLKHYIV